MDKESILILIDYDDIVQAISCDDSEVTTVKDMALWHFNMQLLQMMLRSIF